MGDEVGTPSATAASPAGWRARTGRLLLAAGLVTTVLGGMASPAFDAKNDKASSAAAAANPAGCSENEIFTAGKNGPSTRFPNPKTPVSVGATVGAYYNDESAVN